MKRELGEASLQLAAFNIELGDYDAARKEARDANQIAESIGHPRGMAESLLVLAALAITQERYEEADENLQQARPVVESLEDQAIENLLLYQMAMLRLRQDRLDRAERLFEEVEAGAKRGGMPGMRAYALLSRGEIRLRQGNAGGAATAGCKLGSGRQGATGCSALAGSLPSRAGSGGTRRVQRSRRILQEGRRADRICPG